jgi:hypothetical protein
VTPEQEEVIEEVATEGLSETTEEAPVVEEVLAEVTEPTPTTEAPVEDDRLAKLEKTQEDLMLEIAKLKGEMEAPKVEDLPIEMSDNRPVWKRLSDGINAIKNQK